MKTKTPIVLFLSALMVTFPAYVTRSQQREGLAVVDGVEISAAKLRPYLPSDFESFPPDKAAAVVKIALENAILNQILINAARRRGISVPVLRQRLTVGSVRIPDSLVEKEWVAHARYWGLLSPDEARERLRLDLEAEAKIKNYKAAVARLRRMAKVIIKSDRVVPRVTLTYDGPARGPDDAPVTIAVFSDFSCGYCKAAQPILTRILKEYSGDVRVVFRNFPLRTGIGLSPAVVGVCADDQHLFWEFHDAAYAEQALSPPRLLEIVQEIGLDRDRFDACVSSTAATAIIDADVREAKRLAISATPTFVINGEIHRGVIELSDLRKLIEREIRSSPRRHKH